MTDPFGLQRFVEAQRDIYGQALAELRAGHKRGHWMWFIFPQLRGLGSSATSVRFAISGRDEAEAYLRHPLLAARLRECTRAVNEVEGRSATEIFASPDDMKFRSSLTLFRAAAQAAGLEDTEFRRALEKYFGGEGDPLTLRAL